MPTFRDDIKLGTKVPMMKTDDYNNQSVTEEKLKDGAITTRKIADGSVTKDKLDSSIRQEINESVTASNEATEKAKEATAKADQATENAKQATVAATAAKEAADTATQLATNATTASNQATEQAKAATTKADEATAKANEAAQKADDSREQTEQTLGTMQGVISNITKEQKRVGIELEKKFDKASVVQESGEAEDKVMSQKAVSDKLSDLNNRILTLDNFAQSENVVPEFAIENKYIDKQGNFKDYNGYFISAPIKLKAGKMIYVNLVANNVTPLALSDSTINNDSKVTPLFGYKNLNTYQKFIYTAKEDCYVVVCGKSSASVNVKIIADPDNTLSINDELAKKANAEDVSSQMQTEQERVNMELAKKFDKGSIVQQIGNNEDKVVSQRLIQFLDNYINLYKNKEVIVPSIAIKGHYINFEGSIIEYSTYNISSPIQLNKNETIIVRTISNNVSPIALCEGNTITKEDNLTPVLKAPNNNKVAYYKYTATKNCYVVFCGYDISEKSVVYKATGFSLSLMDIDDNLKAIESDVDNINTKNNEYDKKIVEYDKKLEEYDNKESILHLNPKDTVGNNILQATRQYNNNQGQLSNKLCTLSVLTDIHGYHDNLQRYMDFTNEYVSYIDDMLCLGDTIMDSWVNTMDFFNNVKGSEKILLTIGNHDTCDRTQNPVVWHQYAGKQAYDRYFAPYIDNWKVVQPENAANNGYCWYYKDYANAKVRLIVLDCMYMSKDTEQVQLQWFTSVLTDAKEKGLSVVAAKHFPFNVVQDKDANTFNSLDFGSYDGNSKSYMKGFLDAIETFISSGGEFICWLNGDSHYDFQGLIKDYPNQYAIAFENAGASSTWNDSVRIVGTKSQDSFNFVTFDTNTKLIKVVRVGNNSDRYLRHKNYICYDYKNKKIITCE